MVKEIDHTLSVHRHDIKRRQRKTQIEIERERCLCVSGLYGFYPVTIAACQSPKQVCVRGPRVCSCSWEERWGAKKLCTLLDLCVSSLRRGHANLLCIVPILTDDPRRVSVS